jgi:hypothetical protein
LVVVSVTAVEAIMAVPYVDCTTDIETAAFLNSWPEYVMRQMEMALEAGRISSAEKTMSSNQIPRIMELGNDAHNARIERIRADLTDAKAREAAAGGPGSDVTPVFHPAGTRDRRLFCVTF